MHNLLGLIIPAMTDPERNKGRKTSEVDALTPFRAEFDRLQAGDTRFVPSSKIVELVEWQKLPLDKLGLTPHGVRLYRAAKALEIALSYPDPHEGAQHALYWLTAN